MSIVKDTADYEKWLRTQCTVDDGDLDTKHDLMDEDAFRFLRATYYRWARRIETICPELKAAPPALCVGDIHLENFGTWRDEDGRWVWGVNDFDEADVMPYAFDLVRLTTSVKLAPKTKIGGREAADAILDGYLHGLRKPRPALLDEHNIWIRSYVACSDECRRKFWKKIDKLHLVKPKPADVEQLLLDHLPENAENAHFYRRFAGGGGRGRPRFVVVATWRGGHVVREAKALVPSAWTWAHDPPHGRPKKHKFFELSNGLYRAPDPFLQVRRIAERDFVVRRLSADSRKIDLGDDAGADLELDLLRAMGTELASIHAATPNATGAIQTHLDSLRSGWLHKAAQAASEATEEDFHAWRRR